VLSDWRSVVGRFQTNNIFQQRKELLQSTLMMIREHPLSGSGLGTWGIVYPRFAVFEPRLAVYHAHNEWAEWMAEGGLPFIALLWAALIRAIMLLRKCPWGVGVSTAALHALFDFPFHVYAVLLCLFLIMALMETAALRGRCRLGVREAN
jgi:O-antigen ligase